MSIALRDGATLHPLVLPARADAADAGAFREYADVRNRTIIETTGRDDDARTPGELLPMLRSDADAIRRQWSVRRAGETIGCVALNVPQDDGSRTVYWTIALLREHWGHGLGQAIAAVLETEVRALGRSVVQLWAEQPHSSGATLAAPNGFGSVPHDHIARFLLAQGHRLEQVVRVSEFVFDDAALARLRDLRDEAQSHADGYRVVRWMLPTPPERVAGYAWMKSRMSTDIPSAGMEFAEEQWDAERVARHDDRYRQMGHAVQVTAAEHIATGELCAFNELAIGSDPTATTDQEDTLVLSDHRGHRLGMLVKTEALLSWHRRFPDSARVVTYNAEENRPMLSINESIGYAPIAYEGAWKKVLT
ncbi:GNAT family N-acetyltransferase [Microbacterium sp.]|uniref:GNAT family N-acetyltransferase n=1 Tax=Microbacterium sp. TaxID=51671 RepID=UPI0028112F08|nr:GNAT family N-acetyltransferase [Microbacterium sp.]